MASSTLGWIVLKGLLFLELPPEQKVCILSGERGEGRARLGEKALREWQGSEPIPKVLFSFPLTSRLL